MSFTPLANGAPPEITDATNAVGTSSEAARENHTHAHGNRGGGALHAEVIAGGAAGFMSGTDKEDLDVLVATAVLNTRTLTAGAGLTGGGDLSANRTFDVVANGDGSIVVNANDVQVGVLASDAQHGNRGGGALHAVATTSVAGFMSAADKTTLDGLVAGAVPPTREVIAGAGLTGGGDLSANRTFDVVANADGSIVVNANDVQVGVLASDAQHGNRGGGALHAVATTSVAGFMSAADKTALDGLTAGSVPEARTLTAGAGLTGGGDLSANRTFDVVANADGSIVVNANDVQVGVLASDAQHGNRGGGALHAVATTSVAGFMSAADKTTLDGLAGGSVPPTRTLTAGAGLTGGGDLSADRTFDVVANADGSIVVNANDVQVGVLASDAQHGVRGGGTQHAVATTSVAGFMSAADKTALDAAVPNTRTLTAGAGLTGGGDLTANRTIDVVANADGSIVVNANDVQVGVLASDAQHGVRGGGTQHAVATTSVAGFMSAADKTKLDSVDVALWAMDQCRYFFVDNDNGNDASVGFLDAAPGTTFGSGAVDAVKIKTPARLLAILPKNGNGRMAKILLQRKGSAGVYLDGATPVGLDLSGVHGYRWLGKVGSTDLTNSATDRVAVGAHLAASGPNGDESWTAVGGGGPRTLEVSAGVLPVDATAVGLRLRFKGNVTAALANRCISIFRRVGPTELDFPYDLSPEPAAGDEFFIERPGVLLRYFYDVMAQHTTALTTTNQEMISPTVGFRSINDTPTDQGEMRLGPAGKSVVAFLNQEITDPEDRAVKARTDCGELTFADRYHDEVNTERIVGGTRITGTIDLVAQKLTVDTGAMFYEATDAGTQEITAGQLRVAQGTLWKYGFRCFLGGVGFSRLGGFGASQLPIRARLDQPSRQGAFEFLGNGSIAIDGIKFEGGDVENGFAFVFAGGPADGPPAEDRRGISASLKNCTQAVVFNQGDAIDIRECWHGRFYVDSAVNISQNTVRMDWEGNDLAVPLSVFANTNITDPQGNEILGAGSKYRATAWALVAHGGGPTIPAGQVVQGSTPVSGRLAVLEAVAANIPSSVVLGTTIYAFDFEALGLVATAGILYVSSTLDLLAPVAYLSQTTAGEVQTVTPAAATIRCRLGNPVAVNHLAWKAESVGMVSDGNL